VSAERGGEDQNAFFHIGSPMKGGYAASLVPIAQGTI